MNFINKEKASLVKDKVGEKFIAAKEIAEKKYEEAKRKAILFSLIRGKLKAEGYSFLSYTLDAIDIMDMLKREGIFKEEEKFNSYYRTIFSINPLLFNMDYFKKIVRYSKINGEVDALKDILDKFMGFERRELEEFGLVKEHIKSINDVEFYTSSLRELLKRRVSFSRLHELYSGFEKKPKLYITKTIEGKQFELSLIERYKFKVKTAEELYSILKTQKLRNSFLDFVNNNIKINSKGEDEIKNIAEKIVEHSRKSFDWRLIGKYYSITEDIDLSINYFDEIRRSSVGKLNKVNKAVFEEISVGLSYLLGKIKVEEIIELLKQAKRSLLSKPTTYRRNLFKALKELDIIESGFITAVFENENNPLENSNASNMETSIKIAYHYYVKGKESKKD